MYPNTFKLLIQIGEVAKYWRSNFSLAMVVLVCLSPVAGFAAPAQTPLNISTGSKANLLMILDNSNSMDEDATGQAAGSNNPDSKSEIARGVIKSMIDRYLNRLNMGLMSYQQNTPASYHIHKSTYDNSYNPANFDPNFSGAANSSTKRNRMPNPSDPGQYIYYNIGLPYYSSTNDGSAFCYSRTSVPFKTIEIYPQGPWDTYRCFRSKTGGSDVLPIGTDGMGDTAADAALGYTGFVYQGQLRPTESDLAQGLLDFGKLQTWHYAGPTFFSNTSPGRGFLNLPIKDLDATQADSLKLVLACNVPGLPTPCLSTGIRNAGLTPIQGTLDTALDYFKNSLSSVAEGYEAGSTYPLPVSCGKNFVILLTDGLPSSDAAGVAITDPAVAIQGAADAAARLKNGGIQTYVIGFALPFGTDPATLNTIAAAGGTNEAYLATSPETLTDALDRIIQDVLSKSAAFTALAASSTTLNSDSLIFQATYDATEWSGRLRAYEFTFDSQANTLNVSKRWDANFPTSAQRKLFTLNTNPNVVTSIGTELAWANLSNVPAGSSQQDYLNTLSSINDGLGEQRLNWLRGDQSQEQTSGGPFRKRSTLLGDIARSTPVYVATPNFGYGSLAGSEGTSYNSFRESTSYKNRRSMIYVGSNDGYLHGFDATKTSSGGREIFGYLPNALFPKLSGLTSPSYVHESYVDGPITVNDSYFASAWHTVLVGNLGAGGRGLFALDVTNPDNFAADKVLWEFTNARDTDLGYTLPQAAMGKLPSGNWVTFVANGYDSDSGHAVLFIIDTQTGDVLKKLDTGVGDPTIKNGLSSPLAVDTNKDQMIDKVYAGDLYGNLWKFDVSGSINSIAPPAQPFFVACETPSAGTSCAQANRQPITGRPSIGPVNRRITDHNGVGRMVYFGTGKYFDVGDNIVGSNPQVQSFYGLWDKDESLQPNAYSVLTEQTIDYQGAFPGQSNLEVRAVSKKPVCYTTGSLGCTGVSPLVKGWYMRLITPGQNPSGERVIGKAIMSSGLVVFSSLTPSADLCSLGGSSAIMRLDALTGGEPGFVPTDYSGNGKFGDEDKVTFNIDGATVTAAAVGSVSKGINSDFIEQTMNQGDSITAGDSGWSGDGVYPNDCPSGKKRYLKQNANTGVPEFGRCEDVRSDISTKSWRQLR